MNKYNIYFNIYSKKLYRSVHDSTSESELNEVYSLIDELSNEKDSISIYTTETKMRIRFWGYSDDDFCIFEINNALQGVSYFKQSLKSEIKQLTAEVLENIIAKPLSYGFEAQSF